MNPVKHRRNLLFGMGREVTKWYKSQSIQYLLHHSKSVDNGIVNGINEKVEEKKEERKKEKSFKIN